MAVVEEQLNPDSLYLQIEPANLASVAVAERFGFQPEEMVWDEVLQLSEQRFCKYLNH